MVFIQQTGVQFSYGPSVESLLLFSFWNFIKIWNEQKRIDIVECSFTKMFLEGLVLNIVNFSQSFLANVESGKKAEVEMFTKYYLF